MLSRALGVLIASWLPTLAVILPLSPFHRANALVAGLLATGKAQPREAREAIAAAA